MKRILMFSLITWCAVTYINAQKLLVDKVEDDGSRSIITKSKYLYNNFNDAALIQLGCFKFSERGEQYIQFYLYITLDDEIMQIDIGRKLLIKFSDGSIMELRNCREASPINYHVTWFGTNCYLQPKYILTENQLREIISNDAIKLRIENNKGYIDKQVKKNRLSKLLGSMYKDIQKALSVQKDIYSDF